MLISMEYLWFDFIELLLSISILVKVKEIMNIDLQIWKILDEILKNNK